MDKPALLDAFRFQAEWCVRLGSPFTAALLGELADDLEADGITAQVLSDWVLEPRAAALTLRFAGALHALVLDGQAPRLAAVYPPNPMPDAAMLGALARESVAAHAAFIRAFLDHAVQTNETARSGALLGGFLEISQRTNKPLSLLEIGSSAGLNLMWDRFHYDLMGGTWGDPESPVRLFVKWRGSLPPLGVQPVVTARAGCDINPVDVTQDADVRRALCYIWPDQVDRLARFKAAVAMAQEAGVRVEKQDAQHWLAKQFAARPDDTCTVLFHSIMWQYMPIDTQKTILRLIDLTGKAATPERPFAWLRFEPPTPVSPPEILLTLWPGGETTRLGFAHPHGADVDWGPEGLEPA